MTRGDGEKPRNEATAATPRLLRLRAAAPRGGDGGGDGGGCGGGGGDGSEDVGGRLPQDGRRRGQGRRKERGAR